MKESQHIEFKENWKDEYLKIIAAFANSAGGKLFIGIDDKGKVAGIKNSKELLEVLPNKIKNRLLITPFVSLQLKDGKEFIIIEIAPSSFPVFFEGKIYIRSGSTVQELTGIEISSFLLNKIGQTWDKLPSDATDEELDKKTIERFKSLAKKRLPLIEDINDHKLLLQKLKLYTNDGKLTRAGLMLFGKDPQSHYLTSYTKVGRFKTDTIILDTVEIKGNLFQQLDGIMEAIKKHLNVRFDTSVKDLTIEELSRKDIWDYPLDALREAVINALIHRDYIGTAPIQIKIYEDEIIIWNIGKLMPPLSVEKLKQPHQASHRNPLIASVFYYAGFIEAWGSGTTKIIELCKMQGLPEPEFIESVESIGDFTVKFYKDIYTEENLRKMGLNERQIKAIMYVKERGKITSKEYQRITGISRQMATIELADIVLKGIFIRIGKAGKGIAYQLTKLPNK